MVMTTSEAMKSLAVIGLKKADYFDKRSGKKTPTSGEKPFIEPCPTEAARREAQATAEAYRRASNLINAMAENRA
jgi:hypothetical protein